jgi:peptidoglycan/LPS O-acetylase OafA/YrhL
VAIAVRDPRLTLRVRTAAPFVACAAAFGLSWIGFRFGFIPFEGAETLVAGYSALGILFAALVFNLVTREASTVRALLSANTLRWFGKYSYAIYIFHWPVAQAVQVLGRRGLLPLHSEVLNVCCYSGLVLAISSGVAWITWHCLEAPLLSLKRFFEYLPAAQI